MIQKCSIKGCPIGNNSNCGQEKDDTKHEKNYPYDDASGLKTTLKATTIHNNHFCPLYNKV